MKKVIHGFLIISSNLIITTNSLLVVSCTGNLLTQADYVAMYDSYYNSNSDNPYNAFIDQSLSGLETTATPKSYDAFDNLYDNSASLSQPNFWNDFTSLQMALTTTKIGSNVIADVNWNDLYQQAGLTGLQLSTAQDQQLRFYNILAKIYGETNVLKLVQWVNFANPSQSNVIAYTTYYPVIGSQTQTYGSQFVDMDLINEQYSSGFWSSDEITSVSTHEYGHALSNFLSAAWPLRAVFNTTPIPVTHHHKIINHLLVDGFDDQEIVGEDSAFSDRTQTLINFIDADAINYGFTLTDDVENFIFALLTVWSTYSQSSWIDDNLNERDEFFAEAFASWMLRINDSDKDVAWNLLNDFFMVYAPSYYQIS